MNALAVGLIAYVLLGLDLALRPALALGQAGASPQLLLPLMVFVALWATPRAALWTALTLGAAADLTTRWPLTGGFETVCLLGPSALGYTAGAYLVLTARAMILRRNPLSLGALSVAAAALAAVVVVALLTLRHAFFDPALVWSGRQELLTRLLSALYTGVAAIALTFALRPLTGVMGLSDAASRRFGR